VLLKTTLFKLQSFVIPATCAELVYAEFIYAELVYVELIYAELGSVFQWFSISVSFCHSCGLC